MDSHLAAAVGGKEGQHKAVWQFASVQCVCVCVFIKSQRQLYRKLFVIMTNSEFQPGC